MFGDASEQAFCSVAYFRFSYANGSVKCAFVTAKTRVAPKKPLSIPRLELQAAVLSARLSTVVIKEHDYRIDSTYLWTDSSTVFQWIRGESKRHPAFIANRVGEILDTTETSQWNHCPGALNPADDGSRGLPVTAITSESRWLNGPVFLTLSEEKWPKGNSKLESSSQQKQETSAYRASQAQTSKEEFISLAKYSTLTRLLRVTAYSFRFVYNCRCRRTDRQSGPLLVEELERAQKLWIGNAQVKSFPQEKPAGLSQE